MATRTGRRRSCSFHCERASTRCSGSLCPRLWCVGTCCAHRSCQTAALLCVSVSVAVAVAVTVSAWLVGVLWFTPPRFPQTPCEFFPPPHNSSLPRLPRPGCSRSLTGRGASALWAGSPARHTTTLASNTTVRLCFTCVCMCMCVCVCVCVCVSTIPDLDASRCLFGSLLQAFSTAVSAMLPLPAVQPSLPVTGNRILYLDPHTTKTRLDMARQDAENVGHTHPHTCTCSVQRTQHTHTHTYTHSQAQLPVVVRCTDVTPCRHVAPISSSQWTCQSRALQFALYVCFSFMDAFNVQKAHTRANTNTNTHTHTFSLSLSRSIDLFFL